MIVNHISNTSSLDYSHYNNGGSFVAGHLMEGGQIAIEAAWRENR